MGRNENGKRSQKNIDHYQSQKIGWFYCKCPKFEWPNITHPDGINQNSAHYKRAQQSQSGCAEMRVKGRDQLEQVLELPRIGVARVSSQQKNKGNKIDQLSRPPNQ